MKSLVPGTGEIRQGSTERPWLDSKPAVYQPGKSQTSHLSPMSLSFSTYTFQKDIIKYLSGVVAGME